METALPSELPSEVREQDTAKTSVYQAGRLVYDGATQQHVGPQPGPDAADGGLGTLSEMLAWGIKNSDPAELERRAASGEAKQPSRLDQEALDVLLGQPTVAKMRACLGKVTEEAFQQADAMEAALQALEELEFYVEDLDNANDLAKIGGVQAMLYLCSAARAEHELREAACGVLAACLQNNPKFIKVASDLGVATTLFRLLEEEVGEEAAGARGKALYALSALLRGSKELSAELLAATEARAALFSVAAVPHARLRRRAIFLLLALVRDESLSPAHFADKAAAELLLDAACSDDDEARDQALQLLLLLVGSADIRELLREGGAAGRLAAVKAPELPAEQAETLGKLVQELSA